MTDPPTVYRTAQVARIVGLTEDTVRQLAAELAELKRAVNAAIDAGLGHGFGSQQYLTAVADLRLLLGRVED